MVELFDALDLSSEYPIETITSEPQRASKFKTKFDPPVRQDDDCNYFFGVNRFSSTYGWINVSEEYGNNKIQIKKPGSQAFEELVFPDGMWTYERIAQFINQEIGVLKDAKGEEIKGVEMLVNYTTLKVAIILKGGVELDFAHGQFSFLVGFEPIKVDQETTYGTLKPNITNSLDYVYVTCPIAHHISRVGPISHTIYRFSVANLGLSRPFVLHEPNPSWIPIDPVVLKEIEIEIVDRHGRELQFAGGLCVFIELHIGRKPKTLV